MTKVLRLSRRDARRIAIRAQLLDKKRPTDMMDTLRRLTVVQRGEVASVGREGRERLWDLAERIYPDRTGRCRRSR